MLCRTHMPEMDFQRLGDTMPVTLPGQMFVAGQSHALALRDPTAYFRQRLRLRRYTTNSAS